MKKNVFFTICFFMLFSCTNEKPAFRFSNFYDTPAENIVKAIEENNIKMIRQEVASKRVNVDFEDEKYEVSLLELALVNNKKDAFDELLKLDANVNIENSSCVSPLISAIRYNHNCDLFFVKKLLDSGAEINPRFFEKCNNFTHDPICETILYYNDENNIECGFEILKLLTTKLDNPNVLFQYNNSEDYHENIVYNCLSTNKNLYVLKFLIVNLEYKVPKEIFIDGTVLLNYDGYKDLEEILQSKEFIFEDSLLEEVKKDILNYLHKAK